MDAPDPQDPRRPLEHVEGIRGSSEFVVDLIRMVLRSVSLGSRATLGIATYLDRIVERVAEMYLQTGVNLLEGGGPIDVGAPLPRQPAAQAAQGGGIIPVVPPNLAAAHAPPPPPPAMHVLAVPAVPAPPAANAPAPIPVHPVGPLPPAYGAAEDEAPVGVVAGAVAVVPPPPALDQHLGMRYYGVFVGRHPGVYDNWPMANDQVRGVPGNSYRRYSSLATATAEFNEALAAGLVHQVDMPLPAVVHQVHVVEGEPTHPVHLLPLEPVMEHLDVIPEQEPAAVVAVEGEQSIIPPDNLNVNVNAPSISLDVSSSPIASQAPEAGPSSIPAPSSTSDSDELFDPEYDILCAQLSDTVLRGEEVLKGKQKEV